MYSSLIFNTDFRVVHHNSVSDHFYHLPKCVCEREIHIPMCAWVKVRSQYCESSFIVFYLIENLELAVLLGKPLGSACLHPPGIGVAYVPQCLILPGKHFTQ